MICSACEHRRVLEPQLGTVAGPSSERRSWTPRTATARGRDKMQRLYSRAGFERAAKVCLHFTSDRYARHSESQEAPQGGEKACERPLHFEKPPHRAGSCARDALEPPPPFSTLSLFNSATHSPKIFFLPQRYSAICTNC